MVSLCAKQAATCSAFRPSGSSSAQFRHGSAPASSSAVACAASLRRAARRSSFQFRSPSHSSARSPTRFSGSSLLCSCSCSSSLTCSGGNSGTCDKR